MMDGLGHAIDLHMDELKFDDAERVLGRGSNHGDSPVDLRIDRMKTTALRGSTHDTLDLAQPLNTFSRSALTYPLSAQTDVSTPCSNTSKTCLLACSLAARVSMLWATPLSTSMPMCAFMPKYRSLPHQRLSMIPNLSGKDSSNLGAPQIDLELGTVHSGMPARRNASR